MHTLENPYFVFTCIDLPTISGSVGTYTCPRKVVVLGDNSCIVLSPQSTPLHLAAGYNRVRVVQLLLKHRADVHAKDKGYDH